MSLAISYMKGSHSIKGWTPIVMAPLQWTALGWDSLPAAHVSGQHLQRRAHQMGSSSRNVASASSRAYQCGPPTSRCVHRAKGCPCSWSGWPSYSHLYFCAKENIRQYCETYSTAQSQCRMHDLILYSTLDGCTCLSMWRLHVQSIKDDSYVKL